ncbi:hypothetical protein IAU60_001631 [Kwoniella sp. DSM 27419]
MLPSLLLLATMPLALGDPLAAAPTPLSVASSAKRGITAQLSHGAGHARRARDYVNAKQDKTPSRLRHRQKRHSGGLEPVMDARDEDQDGLPPSWLLWAGARVDSKYNAGGGGFAAAYAVELSRRQSKGEVSLTNHNLDTSYSATLSVGSPAQPLDIVLDTGSSDLWVADNACDTNACSSMSRYDMSSSSSSVNLSSAFSIEYGSGKAAGSLVQDLVSIGGYSVASQTFASCDDVSDGLLSSGVSGIMGLSWQTLAYSKATPWWLTLAKSSSWSDPLFAFHLARYRNVAGAKSVESEGGVATFGFLDKSLYTGDVTYVSVSDDAQYWQIPMDGMTVQGKSVSVGSSNVAAIDTGTTLIGGPESIVTAIYANIPGSQRMTGSYAPYFAYPCNTNVNFDITFGGFTIKITDQDFNLGRYTADQSMCTGAVYVQALPSSAPIQWIVGDAAIKNTYTVFRYSPAAVGFANLAGDITSSEAAQSTTIPDVSALTATSLATASGTASTSSSTSTTSSVATSSTSGSSALPSAGTAHVVTATGASGSASGVSAVPANAVQSEGTSDGLALKSSKCFALGVTALLSMAMTML